MLAAVMVLVHGDKGMGLFELFARLIVAKDNKRK